MTTISRAGFDQLVGLWAGSRGNGFKYNWPVKGGWEAWIQVDLTAFILQRDGTFDVLREQPVYTNERARCDLLINASDPTPARLVVELKAESLANYQNLGPGVDDDVTKIGGSRAFAHAGSVGIVLAVVFSPQGFDAVRAIRRNGYPIFSVLYGDAHGEFAVLAAHQVAGAWENAARLLAHV